METPKRRKTIPIKLSALMSELPEYPRLFRLDGKVAVVTGGA